jgi:hypothetical protein
MGGGTRDPRQILRMISDFGELPEAYSRVTNPERFQPLHDHALDLFAHLETTYHVRRSEAFELLPMIMQPFEHALPPITLTPAVMEAAPISIGFTTFPSVLIRCGRWYSQAFPSCGCDACAATATGEIDRLDDVVRKVVAGAFAEELRVPLFRDARLSYWLGVATSGDGSHGSGWSTLPRAWARALPGPRSRRIQWRPWPRRESQVRDPAA